MPGGVFNIHFFPHHFSHVLHKRQYHQVEIQKIAEMKKKIKIKAIFQ